MDTLSRQQRAGFWDEASAGGERRPESRQFKPNKQKQLAQQWIQEEKQDQESAFEYTPFKTHGGAAGAATAAVPKMEKPHTGTLRPKAQKETPNPFVYQSLPVAGASLKDQPASQSTPKLAPKTRPVVRPEQNKTWGRGPSGPGGPPLSLPSNPMPGLRSSSVMGHPTIRPNSRISQGGMPGMHNFGSRYQSYCTLPRPEAIDPITLEEMHGTAFYGGVPAKMVSRAPSTVPPPVPSMPGMASDFVRPPTFAPPPLMQAPPMLAPPPVDIVSWNAVSLICSMQMISAIAIFGLGVTRMLMGAKWAIGVELAFALSVFLAALIGIYSIRGRSASAAVFSLAWSGVNGVLALIPMCIALLPTIPWTFSGAEASLFSSHTEPIEFDLTLAVVCLIQFFLSLLASVSLSRSLGRAVEAVDRLRMPVGADNAGFEMPIKA